MTLGDMELFETITGKSFGDALRRVKVIDPDTGVQAIDPDPKAKGKGLWQMEMSMSGMVAMVYITLKKEEPDITLDAVRQMTFSEFEFVGNEDAPLDSKDSAKTS